MDRNIRRTRWISGLVIAGVLLVVGLVTAALFTWTEGLMSSVGGVIIILLTYWTRGHPLHWVSWIGFVFLCVYAFLILAIGIAAHTPPASGGTLLLMNALAPYILGIIPGIFLCVFRYYGREAW